MFFLAQQNDAFDCLVQFGMVAFILSISFISWVVKKLFASLSGQATAQRRTEPSRGREAYQSQPNRPNPYVDPKAQPSGRPAILEAEVVEPTVEHHLGSNLSSEHLAKHAAQLGDLDERGGSNAHEQFDYDIGRLGDSSDAVHEDPDADKLPEVAVTVTEIADVFRHPERVREAIILNEILSRPDF